MAAKKKTVKKTVAKKRTTSGRKSASIGVPELEQRGVWLSIHAFCQETGKDRQSVDKKVRLGIITPIKGPKGQALYKLHDLINLVFYRDDKGAVAIDRLAPMHRKAHYEAELAKQKMMQQATQLIPASEVEAELARVAKALTQFLDTLPDILERDCGLNSSVLQKIEGRIDACREDLHRHHRGRGRTCRRRHRRGSGTCTAKRG
jgi:hypothetical protein